jgi:peptide/nickel transport system substrate-binding protein
MAASKALTAVWRGRGARGMKRSLALLSLAVAPLLLLAVLIASGCGARHDAAAGAPRGGTLTVACQSPTDLDPHFAATGAEEMIDHQIFDLLVELDSNNRPVPDLATAWSMSPDGKTWTFTIRDGVKFSDGQPLTVDDIAYSFRRMTDPDVGAPTSSLLNGVGKVQSKKASSGVFSLFSTILSVDSSDDSHVVFHLRAANPEFVKVVADYHAAIISHEVKDPSTELVGSGPFMVRQYLPGQRIVLVRNPNYWGRAPGGARLPYLDEITFVFLPDEASQLAALGSGRADFVAGLSVAGATQLQSNASVRVLSTPSNFHYVVHLRCDAGHPGADPRVRLALRLGTDYEALIERVRPGFGDAGNGTPVGRTYVEYYWDQTPPHDLIEAKRLLAKAGYGGGFQMTLDVVESGDAAALAAVWKQQMARIGVTVDVRTVPPNIYYGTRDDESWKICDFGVTDWADRATPVSYFDLGYVTGGRYNESHWSDAEFDALTAQIGSELNEARRVELYRRAQQILWERGPVVVLGHEDVIAAASKKFAGIVLPIDWARVSFAAAHLAQ